MADRSAIEWTDATWNPIRGCSRVSEGCRNCYAERDAIRHVTLSRWVDRRQETRPGPYDGLVKSTPAGPRWTGTVRFVPEVLDAPLRWRKPRRIFVNSMSDLFHEKVEDEWIDRIFAIMAICDGKRLHGNSGRRALINAAHTFQILTKRPDRMAAYLSDAETPYRVAAWVAKRYVGYYPAKGGCDWHPWTPWPLPNVWLGTSVEDQATADARIPALLRTPAAVRFVSYEPALGGWTSGTTSRMWPACVAGAASSIGLETERSRAAATHSARSPG